MKVRLSTREPHLHQISLQPLRTRVSIFQKIEMSRQAFAPQGGLLLQSRMCTIRLFSNAARYSYASSASSSVTSKDGTHTTNKDNELDVQSSDLKGGQRDRQSDNATSSSAATERKLGNDSEQVKKYFPEAPPGPVLGMNDERGGEGPVPDPLHP